MQATVHADIVIVGQGLAGTLLGWEFERAGIPFAIVDAGHAGAASQVAAGIINPITGRRLVKSWRVDALLPLARATYCEIAAAWDVPLWREMRVRRIFADDRERKVFADKETRGDLAPFAGTSDAEGCWVEGAARVDLPALLSAARKRWRREGILREERVDWTAAPGRAELVIDCTGARGGRLDFVPWEFSKGEVLAVAVDGLDPAVVLNRGHWVCPTSTGMAMVGATHEPGRTDKETSAKARATLEASATAILRRPFSVNGQWAGVRVNLPDRHPVVGRHPSLPRIGIFNGLGSKGALLAPWLARQWVNHLTEGVPFDSEVETGRFIRRRLSQA